jgi:glutamate--cysteine ligase
MLFVRRDGQYRGEVSGQLFSDFLRDGTQTINPIFQDWTDQLTTIFTEARLKQFIELRSIDCVGLELSLAAQAFWKGLLYDDFALTEALKLAPVLKMEEWRQLRWSVARDGLAAKACGVNVGDVARQLVELAVQGLRAVAPSETSHLDSLQALVCDDGLCPADILLRNWYGRWNRSPEKLFDYLRVA